MDLEAKHAYEKKFAANQKITGRGMDTTMHVPCPFCAEPEFLVHTIINTEEAYGKGAVCQHCKRGMKGIFHHDQHGGIRFEIVQTCGDDPPDFLPPLRRVQ